MAASFLGDVICCILPPLLLVVVVFWCWCTAPNDDSSSLRTIKARRTKIESLLIIKQIIHDDGQSTTKQQQDFVYSSYGYLGAMRQLPTMTTSASSVKEVASTAASLQQAEEGTLERMKESIMTGTKSSSTSLQQDDKSHDSLEAEDTNMVVTNVSVIQEQGDDQISVSDEPSVLDNEAEEASDWLEHDDDNARSSSPSESTPSLGNQTDTPRMSSSPSLSPSFLAHSNNNNNRDTFTSSSGTQPSLSVYRKMTAHTIGLSRLVDYSYCDVCLEEYKVGQDVCWSPNKECNHVFHKHCIMEWLLLNPHCPVCRRDYLETSNTTTTTTIQSQQQSQQHEEEAC